MKKIGLVSLGCAKNLIDSEILLASFKKNGYEITTNPKDADVLLVNTCAFIEEAKKESLDNIIDLAKYHKTLIVTGCLAERYYKELTKELKEADAIIPFHDYNNLDNYLNKLLKEKKAFVFEPKNRILSLNNGHAYVRIAEGCNNFCSFCAIPYIRGRYKSRNIKDIIDEIKLLVKNNVKEITLIAQDVSNYGFDLHNDTNIVSLLKEIEKIKEIKHIRMLYLYPYEINNEFIEYVKNSNKVYPYFDIPLQHISDHLLKEMHRKGNQKLTISKLNKIRKEIPNAIFRTTMMVGFPNEKKKDFDELIKFVKDFKFDHLGAFTYSQEEGTKAYSFSNQISDDLKNQRYKLLLDTQRKISYSQNLKHIGDELEGLCVYYDNKTKTAYFYTKYNAPDDVDGHVFAVCKTPILVGQYYRLKVIDAFVYDLLVEIL